MGHLVERFIHKSYIRVIFPRFQESLAIQRVKLFWFGWAYLRIVKWTRFFLISRIRIIYQFLRIDWHIEHFHWPCEMLTVCDALVDCFAQPGWAKRDVGKEGAPLNLVFFDTISLTN